MINFPSVAFVVPCYNEEKRLQPQRFLEFARQHPQITLYMVNDGSRDNTIQRLNELSQASAEAIKVIDLPVNQGKAGALRASILQLARLKQYEYLGFIDADLSAPLLEIPRLVDKIYQNRLQLVAGARVKMLGHDIVRSTSRHYFGRMFVTYQDMLLRLGNYDTQCGLKVFRSDLAELIFSEPFLSSWFFDIELFVRTRQHLGWDQYPRLVAETPLMEWKEVGGSKLKWTDFAKAPFEVWKIYRGYKNRQ